MLETVGNMQVKKPHKIYNNDGVVFEYLNVEIWYITYEKQTFLPNVRSECISVCLWHSQLDMFGFWTVGREFFTILWHIIEVAFVQMQFPDSSDTCGGTSKMLLL